jgi:acetylornithine deacetylase/succinyl-diaminopimelate desuccinylase-like protein
VNLTLTKAGSRSNIIPDFAEATLDVRFLKLEDFDAILAGVQSGLAPAITPDTAITAEPRRWTGSVTSATPFTPIMNGSIC